MAAGRRQYPFNLIEPKWQRHWEQAQTFRAWNPGETIPSGHPFSQRHAGRKVEELSKFYILDMFPYPSGAGLHVGHPEGYTATDILARYKRAQGLHVLHPMGWDAFGLPAEQYAIKTGQHPRATTEQNIANFKRQIQSLGFSYDWTREVDTTDPSYFKWTQWIFLKLYHSWFNPETQRAEPIETLTYPPELETSPEDQAQESRRRAYRDSKRLAYVTEAPVWWCEQLGTVLANEEVVDGKSEVGGFPVVRRPMRQWMLRITAYAERLLNDLETIDWSDSLKEMQRNWIGRSEGAEVDFRIAEGDERIRVFTTRPDTLFGATYMVLAPEHRLVERITSSEQRSAVDAYRTEVGKKSDLERTELAKDKTGVFTGAYALNPANGRKVPVWIADYVLISYGTGAIMAVPGHDTRDFEFATRFKLPILQVVQPPPGTPWQGYVDDGVAVHSSNSEISLDGLTTPEAKRKITSWLESKGLGKKTINFKLRDWLFSRQRYWGEPFPIVWKKDASGQTYHEGLPESALPLLPPPLEDYKPTADGQPPLARAQSWVNLPDGSQRETNTMPQWAGSCWYYLRFMDARNPERFVSPEAEQYWMGGGASRPETGGESRPVPGVNLYVGGIEHAVLHLLYARFWHKVLFDLGLVSTAEPFYKLVNQGLILGELEFSLFEETLPDGTTRRVSAGELELTASGGVVLGRRKGQKLDSSGLDTGALIGRRVPPPEVEFAGDRYVLKADRNIVLDARTFKMSKSRGNVINPDDILVEYGADAFRLYEMFMGPLEMTKPWSTQGVEGVYRFLGRVWRLLVDETSETEFEQSVTADPQRAEGFLDAVRLSSSIQDIEPTRDQLKTLHTTIKKVTEDLEGMRFNTAISSLMMFVNEAMGWKPKPVSALRDFVVMLQPFAPHLAEELWAKLLKSFPGSASTAARALAYVPWPGFEPAMLVEDTLEIPVQVNGKLRDVIKVAATASQAELEAGARAAEKVKPFLDGKTVRKVIVVPRKLVNLVVG